VSSYRDQGNPEVIHFPGTLAAYATLGSCAILTLGCFLIAVLTGPVSMRLAFGLPLALVLWAIQGAWPSKITLGERGAWQYTIFGRKRFMISWQEAAEPAPGVELSFLSGTPRHGFAANTTVVIASKAQRLRLVHSPRHSDQKRFLELARKRVSHPPVVNS
jgi:hypothetical protein